MVERSELNRLLAESAERVRHMSPEERESMVKAQRESWVRAEMAWPRAKYRWVNGVKVYESFEHYCND